MPYLIGFVHDDQKFELISQSTQKTFKIDLFKTKMQDPKLVPLDLSKHIGKIITIEAQVFDTTTAYGASVVPFG